MSYLAKSSYLKVMKCCIYDIDLWGQQVISGFLQNSFNSWTPGDLPPSCGTRAILAGSHCYCNRDREAISWRLKSRWSCINIEQQFSKVSKRQSSFIFCTIRYIEAWFKRWCLKVTALHALRLEASAYIALGVAQFWCMEGARYNGFSQ